MDENNYEVHFKKDDDYLALYFDDPDEVIESIARYVFKGYQIEFMSFYKFVSYDFKKGEIY